jgi:nucleotide-binding universal stress UspA family protein
MHTLLVPVDGSYAAMNAVRYAREVARADPRTRLLLLNVQSTVEHRPVHGLCSESVRHAIAERGREEAAAATTLLDRAGCAYELMIAFGKPASVIARVAEERGCSAIVMGSRGLGRLGQFLLGSVSSDVRGMTRIPVTVVTDRRPSGGSTPGGFAVAVAR